MSHHYALFSAQYAPHPGGVESFTANIAHELAAQGNRVTVVTSRLDGSPDVERQDDGVRVIRLPCLALMNGRLPVPRRDAAYRRLLADVAKDGVDRVLVNTRFYGHSLEGLRFARAAGASALVLDHGTAYLVLGNPVFDAALRAYEHGMTALGKRYRPRYAGVSGRSTQWLQTFGIQTDLVVPDAIDARSFRASASGRDFGEELQLSPDQRLVAFVGRLTPEKGALQLARAMRLLGEGFVCAMAGKGFLREDIEGLGVPNVRLLGSLDGADVSSLLSRADFFCLPSRSEGFCISFLEAAAWGVVSVMPRVGIVDEVLSRSSSFGSIVPNTNDVVLASELKRLADAGISGHVNELMRFVEETYSWHHAAACLEACFDGDAVHTA